MSGPVSLSSIFFSGTLPQKRYLQLFQSPPMLVYVPSVQRGCRPLPMTFLSVQQSRKHFQAESQGDHGAHFLCLLSLRARGSAWSAAWTTVNSCWIYFV